MGKGICDWQQWYHRLSIQSMVALSDTGDLSMLHHEQTIFGEEIHTLITFMVNVMASNTVNGL